MSNSFREDFVPQAMLDLLSLLKDVNRNVGVHPVRLEENDNTLVGVLLLDLVGVRPNPDEHFIAVVQNHHMVRVEHRLVEVPTGDLLHRQLAVGIGKLEQNSVFNFYLFDLGGCFRCRLDVALAAEEAPESLIHLVCGCGQPTPRGFQILCQHISFVLFECFAFVAAPDVDVAAVVQDKAIRMVQRLPRKRDMLMHDSLLSLPNFDESGLIDVRDGVMEPGIDAASSVGNSRKDLSEFFALPPLDLSAVGGLPVEVGVEFYCLVGYCSLLI
mmetsp:Transcript_88681/g.185366  ORF Transcript_88681/g.185366 Transcript_88681/m.185366 type:complete len:271 (-) Transcript_88681:342-1154(-)